MSVPAEGRRWPSAGRRACQVGVAEAGGCRNWHPTTGQERNAQGGGGIRWVCKAFLCKGLWNWW